MKMQSILVLFLFLSLFIIPDAALASCDVTKNASDCPSGTYLKTCGTCTYGGGTLKCDCRFGSDSCEPTSLRIGTGKKCSGDIANMNGKLKCSGSIVDDTSS